MYDRILTQSILANPVVGIEICDSEGCVMETNALFRGLVGYDEAEMEGLQFSDLCHDDDKETERQARLQLINGEVEHLTFIKRYLTKSGKIIWGKTNTTLVRDVDGCGDALVSLMIDATDLHRQELLQQGRSRVLEKLYVNHSLEEVCTAIVETIEAVEEGLLCSILQLNATTGTLHKLAAPSLPDFYNDAIDGMKIGEGVGSCGTAAFHGHRVVVADILNHPFWAQARRLVERTTLRSCWSQPIFDNDGKVLGTFAIYYTEPREPSSFDLELINSAASMTALAINHKQAQATILQRDQLKSEFISTAAHELNTPLASIVGYVDLLQSEEFGTFSSERTNEFLNVISQKAQVLSRVVNDLLDVSKIENGYHLTLQKKPAPLLKVLGKVVDHFESHAPQHSFSLRSDGDFPDMVEIDEGRIVQVLENLLSNSVKYSPAGGPIELVTAAGPGKVKVSVVDRGVGMTEAQLRQVFDKFYRADASNTAIQGLGLGLSIARDIVEAHGGEIKLESIPGEGTCVHLTLPHL